MSLTYPNIHKIPDGLQDLLKNLTREVLRDQPTNIYAFAAKYFTDLLTQQQGSPYQAVANKMLELFLAEDKTHSGMISYTSFKKVVYDPQLELDPRVSQMLLLYVDIDDLGRMDYDSFMSVAGDAIGYCIDTPTNIHDDEEPRIHVHGYTREELEDKLRQKFEEHDTGVDEELSRPACRNCFQDIELGLVRREINLLLGYMEENHQTGQVDTDQLAKTFVDLLFSAHEENILSLPMDKARVIEELFHVFASMDEDHTGELQAADIWNGLLHSDLGLTVTQTYAVMGLLADLSSPVEYEGFTEYAAGWLASFENGTVLHNTGDTIVGLTSTELYDRLIEIFSKHNSTNPGSTSIDAIAELLLPLNFSQRELSAVLSVALPLLTQRHIRDEQIYEMIATTAFDVCYTLQRLGIDIVAADEDEDPQADPEEEQVVE
ncbi:putative calcium-binding protein CML17 [Blattamonas nauphoetae]|uniref:Calcium-binding protein CML17 n=1 Tax=Blattamonas nauphoetae TaxID=2049346 RepID=A0ABQ9X1W9_9EUKA|nr:putative calcium-binding protein CML17 [Blattamonas nauphoetae]